MSFDLRLKGAERGEGRSAGKKRKGGEEDGEGSKRMGRKGSGGRRKGGKEGRGGCRSELGEWWRGRGRDGKNKGRRRYGYDITVKQE